MNSNYHIFIYLVIKKIEGLNGKIINFAAVLNQKDFIFYVNLLRRKMKSKEI